LHGTSGISSSSGTPGKQHEAADCSLPGSKPAKQPGSHLACPPACEQQKTKLRKQLECRQLLGKGSNSEFMPRFQFRQTIAVAAPAATATTTAAEAPRGHNQCYCLCCCHKGGTPAADAARSQAVSTFLVGGLAPLDPLLFMQHLSAVAVRRQAGSRKHLVLP